MLRNIIFSLAALTTAGFLTAAAAGLDVTGSSLASGSDSVGKCDTDGIDITWGPGVYETSITGYKITTVTLSDLNQPACAGFELRLQLSGASGAALGAEKIVPDIDSLSAMTFDFAVENIPVSDVYGVHVGLADS